MNLNHAQELSLQSPRGELAALHWPCAGGIPVLCLHGWLDNAASFVPLSQHLTGLDLVALELPGHGHSAHLPDHQNYYFADYLWDIDASLDQLGWSQCHLMGHSMGAALSALYAAADPHRVRSITLLDALGPLTAEAKDTASRLRRSLASVRGEQRRKKAYPSVEAMMQARQANVTLSDTEARLICERAARRIDDEHYQWRDDAKLHWVSPVLMTEEQGLNLLSHVEAPVLSYTATPLSRYWSPGKWEARAAALAHGRHLKIEAHHHMHMDLAATIAPVIQSFILEHETAGAPSHD